jgi:hypothetical protein
VIDIYVGEILDPKRLSTALMINQNVLDCNHVGHFRKKIIFPVSVGEVIKGKGRCRGAYVKK